MIKDFKEFLNEYTSYRGPFQSAGFKNTEPTNEFSMSLDLVYNKKNNKILKDVLSKYTIPYDNLKLKKGFMNNVQKLYIKFLTYNELEAASIVNSILRQFNDNGIEINLNTLQITPDINLYKRKRIKGFGK